MACFAAFDAQLLDSENVSESSFTNRDLLVIGVFSGSALFLGVLVGLVVILGVATIAIRVGITATTASIVVRFAFFGIGFL